MELFNDAKTAAGETGQKLNNMSTQAMIDDARMKVNAAWEARMQLSETDRGALQTLRDNFMAAQETRARYLYGKVRGAITDINDYDPTTITAARKALTDAEDAYEKAGLTGGFANFKSEINARQTQGVKKNGEAMYAAMDPSDSTTAPVNALNNLASVPYQSGTIRNRYSLEIDPAAGAGSLATSADHTAVNFFEADRTLEKKVKKIGLALSVPDSVIAEDAHENRVGQEWYVSRYEKSTGSGSAKVTDRALVYNDRVGGPLQRPPTPTLEWDAAEFFKANPFQWVNISSDKPAPTSAYDPDTGKLNLLVFISDEAIESLVFDRKTGGRIGAVTMSPADGHADSDPKLIKIPGTYFGAEGHYYCDSTKTCNVGTGVVGPSGTRNFSLSTDWYFIHKKGATVKTYDSSYMYFGWWVRENHNGMPAAVSAFYRHAGGGINLATAGATLTDSATFQGHAIGVYAIHDPLNGKGEAGEFTAMVNLKAEFNTTTLNPNTGMTGTIDQFTLNDGSTPDWSVTLNKSAWTTTPSDTRTAQVGHTTNTANTTWEIGGDKASPAGSWVASMYDEVPGTVEEGGDGTSVNPTSALGKWQAEFRSTHRMVGAFGARRTSN